MNMSVHISQLPSPNACSFQFNSEDRALCTPGKHGQTITDSIPEPPWLLSHLLPPPPPPAIRDNDTTRGALRKDR